MFVGFCGQRFLSYIFIKIPQRLFARIPIVRAIFRLSNDLTQAIFSEDKKTFQETVLIPFPHSEALTMGFVTGNTPELFNRGSIQTDFIVFIPTAPHPISGYLLFAPKKIVRHVDVSVEDAFKFLISCGVLHPGKHQAHQDEALVFLI
jgi:uncharacterized membrane protein